MKGKCFQMSPFISRKRPSVLSIRHFFYSVSEFRSFDYLVLISAWETGISFNGAGVSGGGIGGVPSAFH